MPTWRSQSFLLPTDGSEVTLPLPEPGQVQANARHVAGSDIDVIQLGGKGHEVLKLPIWLETVGQWAALKALEGDGTAGDITSWPVMSGGTVTLTGMQLIQLSQPRRYVSTVVGAASSEVVEATAEWWRQSVNTI